MEDKEKVVRKIDWDYPEPQKMIDKLTGPGATNAEVFIQFFFPAVFALVIVVISIIKGWEWNPIQMFVAALLGFDMLGGVITNATSSGKRWFHRKGQGFNEHMKFVLIHIFQLALLMVVFDMGNWFFLIGSYLFLLVASAIIEMTALYLQRPIALCLTVLGICLGLYVLPVPAHFEWFLPFFYIKLLVSHLLVEEPYRS